jgi:hypothetical protein
MGVDINNDIKGVSNKIEQYDYYKDFKKDYKNLKKVYGDSFEADKKRIVQELDKYNRNTRKQNNSCTPFVEQLINQLKKLKGSGLDTEKFAKKIFLKSLKKQKKNISELLINLCKEYLSCGLNQTYKFNTTFYIPVDMIDLFGVLQSSPDDLIGKFFYEEKPSDYNSYLQNPNGNPFSMNRELYNRTQNLNQPFSIAFGQSYKGVSNQPLFDITYVETYVDPITGSVNNGNFFKVDLVPRQTYPTVNEFLNDYYSSINVLEYKTFFSYLVDFTTGVLSFGLKEGQSKLMSVQKVAAINRRLSCLCFDNQQEITINSNAKISEIDNLNNSFYELDDVDLRIIEQNVSNIQKGVIEFEDCENLKIPMNLQGSITALENLTFNQETNNVDEIDDALNILYPATSETFQQSLDSSYLQQFLNSLAATVLSPKAILPFMIMLYGTNQPIPQGVKNIESFAKNFKTFYSNFITISLSTLTKSVFEELSKAVTELILFINSDIAKKKREKLTNIIISIITLIGKPLGSISDFRDCKSCVNELLKLLNTAVRAQQLKLIENQRDVPLPLLLASRALSGYSTEKAFMNAIENLNSIGVPTGPMPDGSPNKFVASIYAILDAQDKEMAENGYNVIGVPELTVLPIGVTIPKKAYGKSI